MKQRWISFEEWQLLMWWYQGCPFDKMPGGGDAQKKLTDFLVKNNTPQTEEYKWDLQDEGQRKEEEIEVSEETVEETSKSGTA